jgi:hypothetical protein
MRLQESQIKRLQRFARLTGSSPSEAAAVLIEEGLRRMEFAFVDFRQSSRGREAFLQGSSLAVWEIVMIAKSYQMDVESTADHLECAPVRVQAALNYYRAVPSEIDAALEDNASYDFDKVSRMLPQVTQFSGSAKASVAEGAEQYKAKRSTKVTKAKALKKSRKA